MWSGEALLQRPDGEALVLDTCVIRLHADRHGFDGFLGIYTDVTAERRQALVESFAVGTDPITGLINREALLEELETLLNEPEDTLAPGAFMLVAMDGFDDLASSVGYGISLELRAAVADRLVELTETTGPTRGNVASFSDHEFAVVLPGLAGSEAELRQHVDSWANHARRTLRAPMELELDDDTTTRLSITVSIGVALWQAQATPDDLIEQARVALWRARQDGRDRVATYDQADARQLERERQIQSRFLGALERGDLQIHLQPQIGRLSNVAAAEVLVRWLGADGQPLYHPKDFIPVAERTGLILPLGEHVLRKACEVLAKWQMLGPPFHELELAVNVSAHEFSQVDFAQRVLAIIAETGAPTHRLLLEITETAVMVNMELAAKTMGYLEEEGLRFALDDFGVGHASLLYLMKLPISQLKIDQAFIQKLPGQGFSPSDEAAKAQGIVQALSKLCHGWGWTLVAEGVATRALAAVTADLRCDYRQGFYFSPALPVADFEAYVLAGPGA